MDRYKKHCKPREFPYHTYSVYYRDNFSTDLFHLKQKIDLQELRNYLQHTKKLKVDSIYAYYHEGDIKAVPSYDIYREPLDE